MEPDLVVEIPGKPRTQGSMTLWKDPRTGGERAKYAPETVAHRNLVVGMARQGWGARERLTGPVAVHVLAEFARPKSHYGTGRNAARLKPWAPVLHDQAPDGDKVARLVLDALTIAGVYVDDGQASVLRVEKRWSEGASRTVVEVYGL